MPSGKLDELVAPERALKDRIKQLEAVIAKQHEHIDRLHKTKFVIPKNKRSRIRGSYYRLIIPDTHGSKCNKEAVAACIADAEVLRPREVVLIGDHLDCGGFLAQHHVLGYVAETDYTFEEDVAAGNTFLDQIQAACPDAEFHYTQGNHEQRIEKFCVTMALRSGSDSRFLLIASPQRSSSTWRIVASTTTASTPSMVASPSQGRRIS